MENSIYSQVVEIIAEQAILDVSDISPEASLEELGLDSLGIVESIFALEENFGIQIPFNSGDPEKSDLDLTSVGSIIREIEQLVLGKNS
ncbi:MAG: acyl carrier protein [Rhodobacteraceae bacterium]|nr:phosphopantetheine-binding protein [Paracoccaceae bacterium]MDE2758922.1 phosphopantetheine-binding protein [Paracoccaceae bacterium]MDE2916363.1 phosphopantetheine-binding protein [Paracoccaceae bacterium]MYE37747.1 acyl carrier protein [Paracoccaceae bacterium]MYG41754.1 acyl carrier protein [Paracoccaceae bacterium]